MADEQEKSKQLTAVPAERQRMLQQEGFCFLPKSFEELWNYAKEIANTDFVPKNFRGSDGKGNAGMVLAAWQTGREIGLPPMASLQSIAIINGRPSVHSDGYWALIVSHPMCEWFKETPPDEAAKQGYGECTIKRRGNPHEITRRFSVEEAKTANLLGKDNYKYYLGDMLQNRARHRAGSDAIPEATQGVLPSDVARDLPPMEIEVEKQPPVAIPHLKEQPPAQSIPEEGKSDDSKVEDARQPSGGTESEPEKNKGGRRVGSKNKPKEKESEPNVQPNENHPSTTDGNDLPPGDGDGAKETKSPDAGQTGEADTEKPVKSWKDESLPWDQRLELFITHAPDRDPVNPLEGFYESPNFFSYNLGRVTAQNQERAIELCGLVDRRKRA